MPSASRFVVFGDLVRDVPLPKQFSGSASVTIWLQQTYDVRLADMPSRRRLLSSLTHQLDVRQSVCIVQPLETELSLSPVLDYGTVCRQTLSRVTLCHGSGENLKHFSLDSVTLLF